MPRRTVALIAAVCLTTGWLLASMLTPPIARVQVLSERRAVQPVAAAEPPTAFSEQLHLRLRQAPAAPTPRRNPFAFGTRERTDAVDLSQPRTAVSQTEAPVPPPVVGPLFTLSGIGTSQTAQGTVHTAVLSDGTTVHLVKVGETISGYKVIAITEDSVTLAETAGLQYVLRLR